ncbi:MAG: MFS transporter, partial [Spirochaetaceae bacterium]|nr:MFS transporter [Spirochaetaceae bacterium]
MKLPQKLDHFGLRFGTNYFLYFAIFGIASPYLQIMLRRLGYSPSAVGLFLGLFELTGIVGPIISAQKADKAGHFKPFLFFSSGLILAGLAILVSIRNPFATVLGICLLSLGLKTPTSIMDASLLKAIEKPRPAGKRKLDYGMVRSTGSFGFIMVTLIVQIIPGFSGSSPLLMAMWMGIITIAYLLSLFLLPEMGTGRVEGQSKKKLDLSWIDSTFIIGLLVILLGRLAISAVGSFFSLYLTEYLGWNAVGAMWAVSSTAEVPMMIYARKFIKKWSPMRGVAIASVALVVRLLIYAAFPSKGGAIVGQMLHSLCYGLFLPS